MVRAGMWGLGPAEGQRGSGGFLKAYAGQACCATCWPHLSAAEVDAGAWAAAGRGGIFHRAGQVPAGMGVCLGMFSD